MQKLRFHHQIVARYGDLDPQWHVNNARFLMYSDEARFNYFVELGIFDGKSFWDLPLIVADVHCRFLAPIESGAKVDVSTGVVSIGNKHLVMETHISSVDETLLQAFIETTLVSYDYRAKKSVPLPDELRAVFEKYEGKSFPKP